LELSSNNPLPKHDHETIEDARMILFFHYPDALHRRILKYALEARAELRISLGSGAIFSSAQGRASRCCQSDLDSRGWRRAEPKADSRIVSGYRQGVHHPR